MLRQISRERIYNWSEARSQIPASKQIVVFGAGGNGKCLSNLLHSSGYCEVVFADNDLCKQGRRVIGSQIFSPMECVRSYEDAIWMIPISRQNIRFYYEMTEELYDHGIEQNRIVCVDADSMYDSDEERDERTLEYIHSLLTNVLEKQSCEKVDRITTIVFRDEPRYGVANGPAGVMNTQRRIWGEYWGRTQLAYVFEGDNDFSTSPIYRFGDWIGAIEFGRREYSKRPSDVFIVHDIFSAAGIASMGGHYAIIYNNQGDVVYEQRSFGRVVPPEVAKAFSELEALAVERADYVAFASKGAERFFFSTGHFGRSLRYKSKTPLYNTLNEDLMVNKKPIDGLDKDSSYITVCSVGSLTRPKGFDLIPDFLNEVSKRVKVKIRWIYAGNGPLRDELYKKIENISRDNEYLEFLWYESLDHDEINYLMSVSNVYLMLHRLSIFDIATLEAMYHNLAVVLSDVPGNDEFNIEGNIMLVPEKMRDEDYERIKTYIEQTPLNRRVYDSYFSSKAYRERYGDLFDALVKEATEGRML